MRIHRHRALRRTDGDLRAGDVLGVFLASDYTCVVILLKTLHDQFSIFIQDHALLNKPRDIRPRLGKIRRDLYVLYPLSEAISFSINFFRTVKILERCFRCLQRFAVLKLYACFPELTDPDDISGINITPPASTPNTSGTCIQCRCPLGPSLPAGWPRKTMQITHLSRSLDFSATGTLVLLTPICE